MRQPPRDVNRWFRGLRPLTGRLIPLYSGKISTPWAILARPLHELGHFILAPNVRAACKLDFQRGTVQIAPSAASILFEMRVWAVEVVLVNHFLGNRGDASKAMLRILELFAPMHCAALASMIEPTLREAPSIEVCWGAVQHKRDLMREKRIKLPPADVRVTIDPATLALTVRPSKRIRKKIALHSYEGNVYNEVHIMPSIRVV